MTYVSTDRNHVQYVAMLDLVNSLRALLPPASQSHFSRTAVATELGPALVHILSPDIKMVRALLTGHTARRVLNRVMHSAHWSVS